MLVVVNGRAVAFHLWLSGDMPSAGQGRRDDRRAVQRLNRNLFHLAGTLKELEGNMKRLHKVVRSNVTATPGAKR